MPPAEQSYPVRIRLDADIRARAQAAAKADHRSMTSWIEKAIIDRLAETPATAPAAAVIEAATDYEGV